MHRASAPASPATSRSISASRFDGCGAAFAISGNDERLPETQFATQATDDLAMRDAELRGFDDPGVDVFGRAVGRTGNGIEPAPDVVLASLLLVSLETHDMLFHARQIRPLGCPDGASGFVVLIAIDADDLLLAGFDPFLERQRGFSDNGLDQDCFGSPVYSA